MNINKFNLEFDLKKYRLITENANDLISMFDKRVRFIYINEKVHRELLGYSNMEMIGKPLWKFIHPNDFERTFSRMKNEWKKGEGRIEIRFKKKDGTYIWLDTRAVSFQDQEKNFYGVTISRDITKQKQLKKRLKNSREKYRNLFHKSPLSITLTDLEGIILEINKATEKLYGYSRKEILGKRLTDFNVHTPKQIRKFIKIYHKVRKKQKIEPIEMKITRKDGSNAWVIYHISVVEIEEKILYETIAQDITKLKLTEFKLKESEEKYRLISENSNDLIRILDNKFKIRYINENTHHNILGYKKEDLLGTTARKITHPEETSEISIFAKSLLKEGEARRIGRIKHNNGEWKWFDIWTKLIKDSKNELKGLLISRDITERIKFEEMLKNSEEKYRLIAESASDLIRVLDENFHVEYLNKEAHFNVLGYEKEDFEKNFIGFFVHPDEVNDVIKSIRNTMRSGEDSREGRYKHKNGTWKWFEIKSSKFIDNTGQNKIVTIARDISERKIMEKLIKEENKKLREFDALQKELVNRVSHELKTPLTSVHGAIQLIFHNSKEKLASETLELLEIAFKGSKRLKALVSNVLDISRMENYAFQLKLENGDLIKIIKNCIDEMRYLIDDKNIDLTLSIPKNFSLDFDKIRIEQVIINLISNSIKNTNIGGKIKIKVLKDNNFLKFLIRDNGIGLTQAEMSKLFKKFGKIERNTQEKKINLEGSGLGLYICKEIIERHKGKIWAESEGRDKGSTFIFQLPIE